MCKFKFKWSRYFLAMWSLLLCGCNYGGSVEIPKAENISRIQIYLIGGDDIYSGIFLNHRTGRIVNTIEDKNKIKKILLFLEEGVREWSVSTARIVEGEERYLVEFFYREGGGLWQSGLVVIESELW